MTKIYTAGKMSGLTFDQQMNWRNKVEVELRQRTDKPLTFLHPPMFYNYEHNHHHTEAEVKRWELNQLRTCDIVVVDLNGIESTIGTHYELSFVDAMNMFGNKHIYAIGIGSVRGTHPWIALSMHRVEPTIEDACDYIVKYLLL